MKILVTNELPGQWHNKINLPNYQVITKPKEQETREFMMSHSAETVGILCLLTDKINKEIIEKLPNLKIISNYAVGFDNIDIEYATSRGIVVTNTPGVLTETTADLAWALILAARRWIVLSDKFTREGRFKGWDPNLFLGYDVYGKTLGIIGFGRIGQAVAKRAAGFDMKVVYYSENREIEAENKLKNLYNVKPEYVELDELLRISDIVSINTPLNKETYHLITYEKLKLMKKEATIVNTARGPVIKEEDLVKALKEGIIFSAGLDVYEFEPNINSELLELPNVVLLPHIGSASFETRIKMAEMAVTNLVNFLTDKEPLSVVNPQVLQQKR